MGGRGMEEEWEEEEWGEAEWEEEEWEEEEREEEEWEKGEEEWEEGIVGIGWIRGKVRKQTTRRRGGKRRG